MKRQEEEELEDRMGSSLGPLTVVWELDRVLGRSIELVAVVVVGLKLDRRRLRTTRETGRDPVHMDNQRVSLLSSLLRGGLDWLFLGASETCEKAYQ